MMAPDKTISAALRVARHESAISEREYLAAVAHLGRVMEALMFYADPNNYVSISLGFAAQYDPEPSPIKADKGAKALSAIEAAIDDPVKKLSSGPCAI